MKIKEKVISRISPNSKAYFIKIITSINGYSVLIYEEFFELKELEEWVYTQIDKQFNDRKKKVNLMNKRIKRKHNINANINPLHKIFE